MKENDIRPAKLFEEYIRLSMIDAESFNREDFVSVTCPACGGEECRLKWEKNKFQYVQCVTCGSLYCSPRPAEMVLTAFYEQSESARYWSTVFLPAVEEVRRNKLFRKKAARISERISALHFKPQNICDVGAGYGIFLEEVSSFFPEANLFAIEPGLDSAEKCRSKGFETLQKPAEKAGEWKERFDLVISSEVIEHVFCAEEFIDSLFNLVKPGGYCLVTGLGYEGFDILTLQDKSNSVSPPHHLNFLSIQGFEKLFSSCGFSEVEVMTPGELDVDIVRSSGVDCSFVHVLASRGEDAVQEFQEFLRKHNLSSHVWVWARK